MKKVRAENESGEFVGIIEARNVTEETRRAHQYKCLDPECGAEFHWVKGHKRLENTKEVDPTFARNPSSSHRENCAYDYEVLASRNSEVSFYKDGKYFLRVNFPMGGSWSDMNPRRGRLTRAQRRAAEGNTGKKSVSSIDQVIKFLHEQFGSLDHPALDDLYLDYQGCSYAWTDIFIRPDNYTAIFNAAVNNKDSEPSVIATVRPAHQIANNNDGKHRFQCAFQYASVGGRRIQLAPVLVCANNGIADKIKANLHETSLAVSRPFIPPHIRDAVANGQWRGKNVPVYMYLVDDAQIGTTDNAYWRNPAPTQMTLDLFGDGGQSSKQYRPK